MSEDQPQTEFTDEERDAVAASADAYAEHQRLAGKADEAMNNLRDANTHFNRVGGRMRDELAAKDVDTSDITSTLDLVFQADMNGVAGRKELTTAVGERSTARDASILADDLVETGVRFENHKVEGDPDYLGNLQTAAKKMDEARSQGNTEEPGSSN